MRRSDREIKEFYKIVEVIKKCDVCRMALFDEEYPYIVPLNFGMTEENGKVILYFHGALEGKKYELMAKNPKAAFEMDCEHKLVTMQEKGSCTMEYESVLGYGTIQILSEHEKMAALKVLMKHYHKEDFVFHEAVVKNTNVFSLEVESMTGKMRKVNLQG